MKNIRAAIITISVIVLILCLLLLTRLTGGVHKNDSFTTGNTPGNLNNKGLYCEQDGTVYFANPYDGGAIYSMNPDESKVKKISSVAGQSLNVDKERIYYTLSGKSSGSGLGYVRKATGMYSMKKSGGKSIAYTQDPVGIVALSGNNLYYQHYTDPSGTDIDCISIDKKNNHQVIKNMVSPASVDTGYIYYAGASEDMFLHSFETLSENDTVLYERPMYNPVFQNGYVYYIDLKTNYQLHRYSITTGEDITLTTDRVDAFNVYGDMIYYQLDSSSSDAALKRMTTDGMNNETIYPGIYCDINITSQYVYFHAFGSDTPVFHTPTFGSVFVTEFTPGVK